MLDLIRALFLLFSAPLQHKSRAARIRISRDSLGALVSLTAHGSGSLVQICEWPHTQIEMPKTLRFPCSWMHNITFHIKICTRGGLNSEDKWFFSTVTRSRGTALWPSAECGEDSEKKFEKPSNAEPNPQRTNTTVTFCVPPSSRPDLQCQQKKLNLPSLQLRAGMIEGHLPNEQVESGHFFPRELLCYITVSVAGQ